MAVVELTFGQWLKQRRKTLDMTQDELARRVGCSTMMIYKIEAGERRPSRQVAELLADRLELTPEERPAFVRYARAQASSSNTPSLMAVDPAPSTKPTVNNLPTPLNPFVGRVAELDELGRVLADPTCRLLTLSGPGGIGKTRLAIELATRHADRFADGVCFVALASVSSVERVVPAIIAALGEPVGGNDSPLRLLELLGTKELLLVLDNLEQIVDAAAVLAEIVQVAPRLRLLVTSRERLNLSYEWVFEVAGLPVHEGKHGGEHSALALFLQSARRADASFSLCPADHAQVAQICRLVDGVPLGIELAAAWVRMLPVAEIAREIGRSIDFLAVSSRDLPERHRSLRAVFDHSWSLLSDMQRQTLCRLAVFQGGFTREAAEAVVAELSAEAAPRSQSSMLNLLTALVDKSLLRRREGGRYDLHELVRQYAGEQLLQTPALCYQVRLRHCSYYARLLQRRDEALKGAQQQAALAELVAEIDNLRQAWDFALEQRSALAIRTMARSLGWFYELRCMLQEGATAFEQACAALDADDASADASQAIALGLALTYQGWFRFRLGQSAQALALLQRAGTLLQPADDPAALADALLIRGTVTQILGDYAAGRMLLEESLALGRQSGDRWVAAFCLSQLGIIAQSLGNYQEARELLAESLELAQASGNSRGTAFSLGQLGAVSLACGRHREAQRLLRESLTLSSTLGNAWGIGTAFNHLGQIAYDLGDYREAHYLFRESLAMFRQIGERWSTARMLNNLGRTYLMLGEEREAQRSFSQALRLADEAHALPIALDSLAGLAELLARRGERPAALELVALVLDHPASSRAARAHVATSADGATLLRPTRPLGEVVEDLLEA